MSRHDIPSSGPLPPGFRRLQRNDTAQTNDQWKLNLLRETGSIAPLWTSYARANKEPKMDITRPREPLKPSDPDIMTALKLEYRTAIAMQTKVALETVPDVSPLVIWEHYQVEKERYDDLSEKFKIKFKEIHETFPQENRKVFSTVEKAMSEASVEDVKRTPAGSTAYEQQDALSFLRLAMEVHDYVSPQISDRACQTARLRFEGYRQPPSATIAEHLAEFKRRLDHYCKVRGDKATDIYKDSELRLHLVGSLHAPAWGEWITARQMTCTMPTTLEAVEAALREEEATRILANLREPYADSLPRAAHATRTSDAPAPCSCSECGATFVPKKSIHHRCEQCHKKFAADKKKRRDTKGSSPGSDAKPSRPSTRSAHDTEAVRSSEDDGDGDQAAWASYATTVSALATRLDDHDYIIFDPASNSHVIKDPTLALDLNENGPITRIRGSVSGCIEVRTHGSLGDMGTGPVSTSFTRNLISESAAIAAGYHVYHDSKAANEYRLMKEGRPTLVFKANKEGSYSMTVKEFKAHFPMSYGAANYANDVDRSQIVFTKSQRERADLYRKHHATTLSHAHDERVIAALENGSLTDVPYTATDIRNAAIMHGPCQHCIRAKGTKHRRTGSYPRTPSSPGELLAGDLFQIMGVLFYLLTCRMVNLRIVIRLKNKSASQIMAATSTAIGVWKGYGMSPKVISWDQEPAMVSSAHEIWSRHGVRLEFTPPDGHEKVAERNVRTIKEHVHASILSLGHAVDDVMLEGIVRDTVTMLNFLPTSEVDRSSPRTILDGERLNYKRWSRFAAGQVGEFEVPYPDHTSGTRRELGYVLCHQGDNAVVRLLPSGKRTVVRSAHFVPLEKSPAIIQLIEAGIGESQRQRYNDMLAEISEHHVHMPMALPVPSETTAVVSSGQEQTASHPSAEAEYDDINFFSEDPIQETATAASPVEQPSAPRDAIVATEPTAPLPVEPTSPPPASRPAMPAVTSPTLASVRPALRSHQPIRSLPLPCLGALRERRPRSPRASTLSPRARRASLSTRPATCLLTSAPRHTAKRLRRPLAPRR